MNTLDADWSRPLTDAPLQFDVSAELAASAEEIFAWISDHGRLPEWMPLIRRVAVDNSRAVEPGGIGAVRMIYPLVGRVAIETIRDVQRPALLAYSATDDSLRGMYRNLTSVLTLQETASGHSAFRWRTFATPSGNPFRRLLGRQLFGFLIRRSVRNLVVRFGQPR